MLSQPQILLAPAPAPSPRPESLRVLLTGNDVLARKGLRALLGGYEDLKLEDAEADERLLTRVRLSTPDVLLCDSSAEVIALVPRLQVPALLLLRDVASGNEALAAGARGLLMRDAAPRRIHAALEAVSAGMFVLDEELSETLIVHQREDAPLTEPLTHRELEVMQLLADGLTNKEIATRLHISDHTVKFHVNGILGKLGVQTRTEAVVHAARLGIVVL